MLEGVGPTALAVLADIRVAKLRSKVVSTLTQMANAMPPEQAMDMRGNMKRFERECVRTQKLIDSSCPTCVGFRTTMGA
jgi:hypothetical protein